MCVRFHTALQFLVQNGRVCRAMQASPEPAGCAIVHALLMLCLRSSENDGWCILEKYDRLEGPQVVLRVLIPAGKLPCGECWSRWSTKKKAARRCRGCPTEVGQPPTGRAGNLGTVLPIPLHEQTRCLGSERRHGAVLGGGE